MNGNGVAIPKWLLLILPLIGALVGLGVTYGVQKTGLEYEKKRSDEFLVRLQAIEKKVEDLPAMKTDIEWIKHELSKGE